MMAIHQAVHKVMSQRILQIVFWSLGIFVFNWGFWLLGFGMGRDFLMDKFAFPLA